jgi:N-acetylneuraminic acid mutarotase
LWGVSEVSVRRGVRLVVGGIVVVTVVAASVWLAVAVLPRDDGGTPTPGRSDHPGVTRSIPLAPLAPRSRPHSAWTGDELVVWSGAVPGEADRDGAAGGEPFEVFTDGAAYDPASDTWRTLPAAPVRGRVGGGAVWADDRLVIWGGFGSPDEALDDGAVYLPEQDTWQTLPPAPITARGDVTAAWTGREVLFVGGAERTGRFARVSVEFRDGAATSCSSGDAMSRCGG